MDGEIRTPGHDNFIAQYSRSQSVQDVSTIMNQVHEDFSFNPSGLTEAADNILQLQNKIKELEETAGRIEKQRLFAESTGDLELLNQLDRQLMEINDQHERSQNIINNINSDFGEGLSEVVAYRKTLTSIVALEEQKAKQKERDIALAIKENELISQGRHEELGLSEAEAKKKFQQNYTAIKEAKQEQKSEKVRAEFMSDNGFGGKALQIGSGLDALTGGKFNLEAKMAGVMSKFSDGTMAVLNGVKSAISKIGESLDNAVKDAADFLKNNYTQINSNLKGTKKTFDSIQSAAAENFGVNRFVLQTDYLSKIAELAAKGLNFNLEERAMIQTVSDKTLHTFDATDGTLTRFIRYLGKDVTTSQYGLEYTLRNTLNKVFGDSSYLNELYDNVTSAIQDAALISGEDITPFNSTVQTWLSYMYDYGLSNGVVTKIAEGINYLGTGNVSALASNQDLQRLFLLSMDTAGLNYADILQQGLDAETTNKLLSSVVNYLNEIVNNTEDNLVLQNSYANLFNMSITDMRAIRQLANSDINYLSNYNSASAAAYTSLSDLTQDTKMSTQIDNMIDNAKWVYGFDIATDNGKYMAYKISDLVMNVTEGFTDVKGAVGTVARAAQLVSSIGKFAVTALGLMSVAKGVFSGGIKDAQFSIADNYLHMEPTALAIAEDAIKVQTGARSGHADAEEGSDSSKTLGKSAVEHVAELVGEEKDWTTDDHDVLDILKEFEKTIMKSATSKNYAVAVSLEGLNDEVLTSFASIFADEDAMLKTYEGKNKVIERSLFNYVDRAGVNDKDLEERAAGVKTQAEAESPSKDTSGLVY